MYPRNICVLWHYFEKIYSGATVATHSLRSRFLLPAYSVTINGSDTTRSLLCFSYSNSSISFQILLNKRIFTVLQIHMLLVGYCDTAVPNLGSTDPWGHGIILRGL